MSRTKGAIADKSWRDAIRAAVNELRKDEDSPKKVKSLRLLARRLVDRALEGDIAAIKELGDRLDGKPTQAVQVDQSVQITSIEMVLVGMPKVVEAGEIEVIEDKDATNDGERTGDSRDTEQALTR